MATSQKVSDKFLTCTVFMDIFTDPCTLECQHTFCRKCITAFTKTQPDAISAKSFLCPVCRRFMKVPSPDLPVEEWAEKLKPSLLIQGLLDSFGPGTKDTTYCSYCNQEGETIPATVWCPICDDALCDRCLRVHNRIPSTRHHIVSDLTDGVEIKGRRRRKVTCKEHEREYVEFLCKDCQKAVCQKCCIIYHRKCESVVTIESELPSMKTALIKHKETLLKLEEESRKEAEKQKQGVVEVTRMYTQTEKEIKSGGQKAKEMIDLKVEKLLTDLKEKTDKNIEELKADLKTGEMAIQTYQQQSRLIEHVVESDCEMDIYEMYQSYESGTIPGDTDRDKKSKTIISMRFKNTDRFIKTLQEVQLGELGIRYEGDLDLAAMMNAIITAATPTAKKQ